MYVSTKRLWHRVSSQMQRLLWLSVAVVLALSSRMAVGQEMADPAGATSDLGDAVEDGLLFGDRFTGQNGEAYGVLFRAGWQTGPTVGRDVSIVPIEAMPYAFVGKGMFFTDIHGFRASSDGWGGNFGGGFRYHADAWDRIFGVNTYFDYDNTSGALFRQVGFGLETLGEFWDARANAYFPNGVTERQISINFVDDSERFVGNQILYDQRRVIGSALRGVDMEVGAPFPGRIMKRMDVRAFGGWYYYKGDNVDGFAGWKTRVQANVLPSVALQVELTSDDVFDTNVVFGATWTYGGFRQPDGERKTQFSRMTERVRRNYNVVVAKQDEFDRDLIAINPATGTPYFVEHVASYSPGPIFNGTVENPFLTVADAQANPGGDIIFVHANSVFNTAPNNAVILESGIRTLGEGNGVEHRINVAQLGLIPLPRATNNPNRPIFSRAAGNAVTLTSGTLALPTEFSGFQIGDPADATSGSVGHGIFGDTVSNVIVSQTSVNFSQGDGIRLQDLVGPVEFRGVNINNTGNTDTTISGLHVIGGIGGVTFRGDPVSGTGASITNTGGRALLVENTLAGSFVNLTGTDIFDGTATVSGQGILISNAAGSVTVDNATILNSSTTGIDIQGGTGLFSFRGTVDIEDPLGDAINIENTQLGSGVLFSQIAPGVTITDRNARGINLSGNAGNIGFAGPVTILTTNPNTPPALAAIEYQNSTGDVEFRSNIRITGSSAQGILIGEGGTDNTGNFLVSGTTTITNIIGDGILITDDDATVRFNNVSIARGFSIPTVIDVAGSRGININNSRGNVTFLGTTLIDNLLTALSAQPAIDIQNNITTNVAFDTVDITNAVGLAGQGAGVNVVNNPPSVTFNELNVTTLDGIALFADTAGDITPAVTNTGGLFVGTGVLDAVGFQAIDVQNSVIRLGFESVSSSASVAQGINLINNEGSGSGGGFLLNVTGLNGVAGSGGTITGAAADGVFLQDTGAVSLANMNINGSGVAGVYSETDQIDIFNTQILSNGTFGLEVLNTPIVNLFANTITGNPLSEISLLSTVLGTYAYSIGDGTDAGRNIITDTNNSAVLIRTQGAGTGSTLLLNYLRNTTSVTGNGFDALNVAWNGPITAAINLNEFNFSGLTSGGVFLDLLSPTATSNVQIMSNEFTSTLTSQNVGIDITTAGGPANITIGRLVGELLGNQMTFNSGAFIGGTGMRFNLGANSDVNIFDNNIVMDGDLSQGILFTLVQGPSNLTINNNTMDIDDGADLFVDEGGIIIQGVSGTVTLFGVQNNDILIYGVRDSIFPFFSAPAAINGSIIVNGVTVP